MWSCTHRRVWNSNRFHSKFASTFNSTSYTVSMALILITFSRFSVNARCNLSLNYFDKPHLLPRFPQITPQWCTLHSRLWTLSKLGCIVCYYVSRFYFSPLIYQMYITLHTGALLREKVDTLKAPIFTSLLLPCFRLPRLVSIKGWRTTSVLLRQSWICLCHEGR